MRISLTMKKKNKWTTYLFSLPLFSIRSPVIIHQRTIDYRFSLVSYVCIRVIVNTPSSNINNRRSKLATQSIKIDPFASFGQEIPHSGFDVKVEQQQQIGSIADYNYPQSLGTPEGCETLTRRYVCHDGHRTMFEFVLASSKNGVLLYRSWRQDYRKRRMVLQSRLI